MMETEQTMKESSLSYEDQRDASSEYQEKSNKETTQQHPKDSIKEANLDIPIKVERTDEVSQSYGNRRLKAGDEAFQEREDRESGDDVPENHEQIIRNWQQTFHGGTYCLVAEPEPEQGDQHLISAGKSPVINEEVESKISGNIFPLALVQNAHNYNPLMPFNNQWKEIPNVNSNFKTQMISKVKSNAPERQKSLKPQRRKSRRPKKVTKSLSAVSEEAKNTERKRKKLKTIEIPLIPVREIVKDTGSSPDDKNSEENVENMTATKNEIKTKVNTCSSKETIKNKESYSCECGLFYTTKRSLRRHKRKHEEEIQGPTENKLANNKEHVDREGVKKRKLTNKKLKNSTYNSEKKESKVRAPKVCDICGRTFLQGSNLIKHKRVHSGEKPYVCDYCGKAFASSSSLVIHRRTHTGERPYQCDLCPATFAQRTTLLTHKIGKHDISTPKVCLCDLCGKKFPSPSALEIHKRSHTGVKPYVCDVCGRAFAEASNLKSHKVTHTDNKKFTCPVCNHGFHKLCSLKKHQELHLMGKISVKKHGNVNNTPKEAMIYVKGSVLHCGICSEGFNGIKSLTKHRQVEHGEVMKRIAQLIPKLTADSLDMQPESQQQKHNMISSSNFGTVISTEPAISRIPEGSMTYNDCDNLVTSTFNNTHQTGNGNHACKICSKTFISVSHLNLHMRTHIGFRPFICDICKKGFSQLSNCVSHQKIHSGTKDHHCTGCGKNFSRANHLNKHKIKCLQDQEDNVLGSQEKQIDSSEKRNPKVNREVSIDKIRKTGSLNIATINTDNQDYMDENSHSSEFTKIRTDCQPPPAHTPMFGSPVYPPNQYNDVFKQYLQSIPPLIPGPGVRIPIEDPSSDSKHASWNTASGENLPSSVRDYRFENHNHPFESQSTSLSAGLSSPNSHRKFVPASPTVIQFSPPSSRISDTDTRSHGSLVTPPSSHISLLSREDGTPAPVPFISRPSAPPHSQDHKSPPFSRIPAPSHFHYAPPTPRTHYQSHQSPPLSPLSPFSNNPTPKPAHLQPPSLYSQTGNTQH